MNQGILNCEKNPIVVVIPGLTSDSAAAYIKHLAFKMAGHGWNVVVSNHRGLGGISLTKYMISLIASIMVDGQRISGESLTIYIVNIQTFLYMLLELASVPICW